MLHPFGTNAVLLAGGFGRKLLFSAAEAGAEAGSGGRHCDKLPPGSVHAPTWHCMLHCRANSDKSELFSSANSFRQSSM